MKPNPRRYRTPRMDIQTPWRNRPGRPKSVGRQGRESMIAGRTLTWSIPTLRVMWIRFPGRHSARTNGGTAVQVGMDGTSV